MKRGSEAVVITGLRKSDQLKFGTARYNSGEKKSGFLVPKRRQMKHLDFVLLLVRDHGFSLSDAV